MKKVMIILMMLLSINIIEDINAQPSIKNVMSNYDKEGTFYKLMKSESGESCLVTLLRTPNTIFYYNENTLKVTYAEMIFSSSEQAKRYFQSGIVEFNGIKIKYEDYDVLTNENIRLTYTKTSDSKYKILIKWE